MLQRAGKAGWLSGNSLKASGQKIVASKALTGLKWAENISLLIEAKCEKLQ